MQDVVSDNLSPVTNYTNTSVNSNTSANMGANLSQDLAPNKTSNTLVVKASFGILIFLFSVYFIYGGADVYQTNAFIN